MAIKESRRIPKDLDENGLVKYTERHWDDLDPLYGFWSRRWLRTIEFLRSQHWNVLKKYKLEEVPKWRRYPIIGLTLSVYSDQLRNFLQARVRYSAIPASAEPADIAAAELAEGALKYSWDLLNMDAKKIDLAAWLLATGNGSLRTYWNTDTGVMVPLAIHDPQDPTGQTLIPIDPLSGKPDPTMQEPVMVDAGELGVEVLNPQLVRYPKSPRDGVMVGMLMTPDEVADRYGEKWVDIIKFNKIDTSILTDLSFSEMPGVTVGGSEMNRALVVEHYIPASKSFPNGLWWTQASHKLITKPVPLPGGIVPITQFRWVPIPGSRMGATPLYDVTYSNKMYDEVSGKIQEWAAKVIPKRLLIEGGGVEPSEFNDEPGQEVVINAGGEPGWDQPPPIPAEFFKLLDLQQRDVRTVGGYDYAQPERPVAGQVQAGRQPQRTKEAESGASLLEIMSKPSWEYQGRVIISYIRKFYTADRMLAVMGKDKQYQWLDFSRVDLKRLPSTIHVDEMPLYASNRQATRDTVIALMGTPAAQVIFSEVGPDGQMMIDKDRIEVAMDALGVDVGLSELDPDIAEARNEHMLMRMGEQVEVADHQNHVLHIAEHERVKKGIISYRAWPPEAKQALDRNIQEHQQILQQQAQAEQQQQIDFERQMREIRETAAMQADVKKELATMIIEGLGDVIKSTIKDALGGDDDGKNNS